MKDLFSSLSEAEMDRLNEFLLDRIPEDGDNEAEKDGGIFNISMLDGFFTAIVSSQNSIMPSQWMPAVWGDYEQIWEREAEAEEIISLMMRHMNEIVHFLMEEPENFEPMYLESVRDGKSFPIVDDWCEGYLRGMKLDPDYWKSALVEIAEELIPIYAFGDKEFEEKLVHLPAENVRKIQEAIVPAVLKLHAYALRRRRMDIQVMVSVTRIPS